MTVKTWVYSNETVQWTEGIPEKISKGISSVNLNGNEYQAMKGFGGCFNEAGYIALLKLNPKTQEEILSELFGKTVNSCNLSMCRLPIGANDYSIDWYSLNESQGDYEMKNFSLERDETYLIPYIKRALAYQEELELMASPWSPPTWMKYPPVYNWGKLIKTDINLKAYAKYFRKFVEEYGKRGIKINQVHVQNEPVANQKFPSCMWTGEELRDFIRDYLGPEFKSNHIDTEIWLGTINAPGCDYNRLIFDKWASEDYDYFANVALSDDLARQYISGVSYQWGGKIAIQRTFESWWPEIRLMQSENECGFGDNTWDYARYVWTMLKHYISNGAESYLYWNLMLEPGGKSTWGDPQNAMITIHPENQTYLLNPDFYVMKHFSAFIKKGAVRLGLKGPYAGDALAFRNPDGTIMLEIFNPFKEKREFIYNYGENEVYAFVLEPQSINTISLCV